jgi:hypothetical protein
MNTRYKTLRFLLHTILILFALMAVCLPAKADVSVINVGITNLIGTNLTSTAGMGNPVAVKNDSSVGAELRFAGSASGTEAVTMIWARSMDGGTTYETAPRWSWVMALNGTTAVVARTNIPSWFVENSTHIKVISIANASTTANGTNASLRVSQQRFK